MLPDASTLTDHFQNIKIFVVRVLQVGANLIQIVSELEGPIKEKVELTES